MKLSGAAFTTLAVVSAALKLNLAAAFTSTSGGSLLPRSLTAR